MSKVQASGLAKGCLQGINSIPSHTGHAQVSFRQQ